MENLIRFGLLGIFFTDVNTLLRRISVKTTPQEALAGLRFQNVVERTEVEAKRANLHPVH